MKPLKSNKGSMGAQMLKCQKTVNAELKNQFSFFKKRISVESQMTFHQFLLLVPLFTVSEYCNSYKKVSYRCPSIVQTYLQKNSTTNASNQITHFEKEQNPKRKKYEIKN